MKRLFLIKYIAGFVLFFMCISSVLEAQTVLNNGLIRFGTGSENSVNSQGLLQQPWYYNGTVGTWYKLTYSSYPLDMAIGVGGDGTNEWNTNGSIANTQSSWTLTNQVIDESSFNADGTIPEYGTIISTGEMTIDGISFEVQNTYTLPEDKGYIEIKSKITNIDTESATNVRMWVGTRDDWVGTSDGPTKVKGNIIDGEFVQISNQTDRSSALQIYSGNEAVLFYSTSPTGNTSISYCCSFANAMYQDPSTSMIVRGGDGSYCYYMRLSDLAPDESEEVVWYYAAGSLADIGDIISDVAEASGAVSNITDSSADYTYSFSEDGTMYYVLVPGDSTAPTAEQIKAGVDYSGVTVIDNGSSSVTADVDVVINFSGLTAETNYDIYAVTEYNDGSSDVFSSINNSSFTTLSLPEIEAECKDTTVYLGADGYVIIDSSFIDNGSSASAGIAFITLDIDSFSYENIGENTVELTVTDNVSNTATCTSTVTVVDTIAPVIVGRSIEVYLDSTGYYKLTEDDISNIFDTIIDNSRSIDLSSREVYPNVFDCVHVDPEVDDGSILQLTVRDTFGNESKEWIPIYVKDTIFPNIEIVADIEIELEAGSCDTETGITYPEISASDNCDFELEQIAGLGADGIFPIGSTTETWVATDKSGNSDTLNFIVTVTLANAAPTINEIADIEVDEDSGPVVIEVSGISYGIDCVEQGTGITAGIDSVLVDSVYVTYNSGDSTGTITYYLAPEIFGDTLLSVVVRDTRGGTKREYFRLTVNPVNDAPFLVSPIPDQVIHASWVLKIPISSTLGEIFDDIDDDELSIEIVEEGTTGLPDWITISGDTMICEPMIENTGYYNIVVMATDTSGAAAADTFEIFVDGYPVGVGDIEINSFEVQMYPNPTKGNVLIEFDSSIHKIELSVMDITGKLVLNQQYSGAEKIAFDMSDRQPGMYFVKMNIDGLKITKKLIVVNK